jgi:arginine decarboxylase
MEDRMIPLTQNPDIYFLCSGSSEGQAELTSFDGALLASGIGNTNLIRLSSILPPHCAQVQPFIPRQGSFLPIAYAAITSSTPGEIISAAVSVAIPDDRSLNGVIMEHSSTASLEVVEKKVRALAVEAMEMRGITDYSIQTEGIETTVKSIATAFAGVALNYEAAAGEVDYVVSRKL